MGFWRKQLIRFQEAVEKRDIDSFFIMSAENSRNMRTVYARMKDIGEFISYLEAKADEEENGGSGAVLRSIGGA